MPNPILPLWEYIPDGEPRVFGDRVYLYGSHDRAAGTAFCDHRLKVWSAPLNDLNAWQCHGISFRTRPCGGRPSDTPWTDHELYAPDVIEKDGRYYLYAYILGARGAVAVSDCPEGPFTLLGQYRFTDEVGDGGIFNDAGVLADRDGRVYVYYGYEKSFMNELDPATMRDVIPGSLRRHVIADGEDVPREERFFEASSIRRVGDTYYLIYSPRVGSRLNYATSDSPRGPFTVRGYIVDNGADYPGGNDHGSIACLNGQWYVFYHRMTNGTIMSRRACAEKITILPDGTIPPVEMTSLGFEESLDPYRITPAEIACVLRGGCFVTEKDLFTRVVTGIGHGSVIGYKYFDFGADHTSGGMTLALQVNGTGVRSRIRARLDDPVNGEEIAACDIGTGDGVIKTKTAPVRGRHALYLTAEGPVEGWTGSFFRDRMLFELKSFVFMK